MRFNRVFPIGVNPITLGNLPTSFDESMSYYEAILWLYKEFLEVKKLVEELKTKVDGFEEKVDEIITRFNEIEIKFNNIVDEFEELKNYVIANISTQNTKIEELENRMNDWINEVKDSIVDTTKDLFQELIDSGIITINWIYDDSTEELDIVFNVEAGITSGENIGF